MAAPSANLSGKPSPTRVEHVIEDFAGLIPLIIAGGSCLHGLESSVVLLNNEAKELRILRPGKISYNDLFDKIDLYNNKYQENWSIIKSYENNQNKDKLLDLQKEKTKREDESQDKVQSPGMKYRHYAPNIPVLSFPFELLELEEDDFLAEITKITTQKDINNKIALILPAYYAKKLEYKKLENKFIIYPFIAAEKNLLDICNTLSQILFAAFRKLENEGAKCILVPDFYNQEELRGTFADAYHNRLNKACSGSSSSYKQLEFVCTANTCRSPLAEAFCRQLAKK